MSVVILLTNTGGRYLLPPENFETDVTAPGYGTSGGGIHHGSCDKYLIQLLF